MVAMMRPLPRSVRELLDSVNEHDRHAGLVLDKYARSWPENNADLSRIKWWSEHVQKPTLDAVVTSSNKPPNGLNWAALRERRVAFLKAVQADPWQRKTQGALTLHLARASVLENAGICLHRTYGFAYLPGTGLKGLARAYAETIWVPAQQEPDAARDHVLTVFGNAPDKPDQQRQRAGTIVFHDAWPVEWPKLIVDIVNSHHREYYAGKDDKDAPGDWESPIPVYFLALPSGQEFSFALSRRQDDVPEESLQLARTWLDAALTHLGFGAKTNAGYGYFVPTSSQTGARELEAAGRAVFEATLELVSPAFLAGANQQREDCDLRPATLRGQLRWWWRTMHAGYVDVATLRAMEAAIWGDTEKSGAVRIAIRKINGTAIPCPIKNTVLELDDSFQRQHGLVQAGRRRTQGLFYFSYGMDEKKGNDRNTRFCIEHGAKWILYLAARKTQYAGNSKCSDLDPMLVLNQAKAALWLLCHFGGVGAKCRKGFGSLADMQELSEFTLEHCRQLATDCRRTWGLDGVSPPSDVQSAALPTPSECEKWLVEIDIPWKDPWFAIDQIGAAARDFAQASPDSGRGKHCPAKKALGLPRNIHGPLSNRPLPRQHDWTRPENLKAPKGDRHASPVLYHLGRQHDGKLVIRISAFPSSVLPNLDESRRMLTQLLGHLQQQLTANAKQHATKGQNTAATVSKRPLRKPDAGLPQSRDRVQAIIVDDPKGKGRPWAKLKDHNLSGRILTTDAHLPADKRIGDELELIIDSLSMDGRRINFRAPTPDDDKAGTKKKGRSGSKSKRSRH